MFALQQWHLSGETTPLPPFSSQGSWQTMIFLGIEVAQSNDGIVISQRKYVLDILEKSGLMNSKPFDTPMDSNTELLPIQGRVFQILSNIEN